MVSSLRRPNANILGVHSILVIVSTTSNHRHNSLFLHLEVSNEEMRKSPADLKINESTFREVTAKYLSRTWQKLSEAKEFLEPQANSRHHSSKLIQPLYLFLFKAITDTPCKTSNRHGVKIKIMSSFIHNRP